MTAAHLTEFEDDTDALITSAVNALIAGRGMRSEDVARAIGVSVSQFYRKLGGVAPWKAREVAALARHLSVSIPELYDGLGGRFGPYNKTPAGEPAGASSSVSTRARPEGFEPPTF